MDCVQTHSASRSATTDEWLQCCRTGRCRGAGRVSALAGRPPPCGTCRASCARNAENQLEKKLGKEFPLPVAEIEWVQACGNYVKLHSQQHDYLLRSTLAAIEKRLDPARFVRLRRGYLVNLSLVQKIEPTDAGDARVRLRDGTTVPCSRTHLEALRQRAGAILERKL